MTPQRRIASALSKLRTGQRLIKEAETEIRKATKEQQIAARVVAMGESTHSRTAATNEVHR